MPLPFISYGRNSLLAMLDGGGSILAVGRRAPDPARLAPRPSAERYERMSRVLIAGGGTAGHVVPALALADVLSERGHEVAFCGTERGMEKDLVPRAGYPFSVVRIRGFTAQAGSLHPPHARLHPRRGRRMPGGFSVGFSPTASWAWAPTPRVRWWPRRRVRGIPAVAVEMDSHMGWTNRILSTLVDRVCLSFPIPAGRIGGKFVYTGQAAAAGPARRHPRRGAGPLRSGPRAGRCCWCSGAAWARTR